jgi:hypothetical protein
MLLYFMFTSFIDSFNKGHSSTAGYPNNLLHGKGYSNRQREIEEDYVRTCREKGNLHPSIHSIHPSIQKQHGLWVLKLRQQLMAKTGHLVKNLRLNTPFKMDIPGKDWWNGLRKRHPEIAIRKPVHIATTN